MKTVRTRSVSGPSLFSGIQTEYEENQFSVRMRETTDLEKLWMRTLFTQCIVTTNVSHEITESTSLQKVFMWNQAIIVVYN